MALYEIGFIPALCSLLCAVLEVILSALAISSMVMPSILRELTGTYGEDAEQPYIYVDIWVCETGGSETESRVQSFYGKVANLSCIIEAGDGITVCF